VDSTEISATPVPDAPPPLAGGDPGPEVAAEALAGQSALEAMFRLIDERQPVERRDAVHAFAKAYTRRLGGDELAAADPEDLYGLVTSTFAFADSRALQPSVVRVFNPDPETEGYRAAGTVIETNTDDSPFLVDSVT
jgi:glutamate dehydrogenase